MMPAVEPAYLLALGIFLIGFEALSLSFFIVWIGMGFIIVAGLSLFIAFETLWVQSATALVVGMALAFFLRKPVMLYMQKSQDEKEEEIHSSGWGVVEEGMIKMDGTYWQSDDDLSSYKNGDKVEVVGMKNNRVEIKK